MILRAAGTVAAIAVLTVSAAGCQRAPDDEMVRPRVTVTAAPQPPRQLPDLPVGAAAVRPGDPVRVEGSTLHVGSRTVDLAPLRVDQWAVVPGGIYFRNRSELWFTDLRRAVPTQYKHVTGLHTAERGRQLVFVEHDHGADGPDGKPRPLRLTYDARTGKLLGAGYLGASA